MVVMKKMMRRAILVVHGGNIRNLYNGTIQLVVIIPRCILPHCKTYTATIRSIVIHGVARKFALHKGA
jgi:hypothetical protein